MGSTINLSDASALKTGRFKKTGEEYSLVSLAAGHIDHILGLQDVAFSHLTENEKFYLANKDRSFFENHFAVGNETLGIVHKGRLIAQAIIVNPTQASPKTGIDLEIDVPLETVAVLQGAIVHPDYRGNQLQGILIEERLAVSRKNGRMDILSEVAIGNSFSWSVLLQKGLHIESVGHSPFTGAEVYVLRGHLASLGKLSNNGGMKVICARTNLTKQKELLADGYKGTTYDPVNRTITFQRPANKTTPGL